MPFENNENKIDINTMPQNSAVKQVESMKYFPSIYKVTDNLGKIEYVDANYNNYTITDVNNIRTNIKKHIMNYGAVVTAILAPNSDEFYNSKYYSYYNNYLNSANHAVLIIGWDDDYSKENFNKKPSKDGAYIVLNSWGNDWGDNGVYYISYEDILVEGNLQGICQINNITFDNIYQYDISEMWRNTKTRYGANVFTANNDETLSKVMIGTVADQRCNIYISKEENNFNLKEKELIASDAKLNCGYTTIELETPVNLEKDKKFGIIVELIDEDYDGIGVEENSGGYGFGNGTINEGESFISDDGKEWKDLAFEKDIMNLSIKAFIQSKNKTIDVTLISGKAYSNIGGNYFFNVSTSPIEDGKDVEVQIIKDNKDVTSQFNVYGTIIKGKGTTIEVKCPDNIQEGYYTIKFKLDDLEIVSRDILIEAPKEDVIELVFKDKNLVKGILEKLPNAIVKNDLIIYATRSEIDSVEDFSFDKKNIKNLEGIQHFENLVFLNLCRNELEDLLPLNNLTKLKYLYLDSSKINEKNLEGLDVLEQIQELTLNFNDIKNLEFVKKMKNENITLSLYKCIKDVEPQNFEELFKNDKIEELNLGGTNWLTSEKLSAIKKLTKLKYLDITNCPNIEDLTFLQDTNIEKLCMETFDDSSSKITTLETIPNMESLKELIISGNKNIKTLNGISKLCNLESLQADHCIITDVSEMNELKNLNNISIRWGAAIKKVEDEKNLICELPEIIKEVFDENSKLYSNNGVSLLNCTWVEYGKSIKLKSKSINASISVSDGNAMYTTCSLYVYNEPFVKKSGELIKIEFEDKELYKEISQVVDCENRNEANLTITVDRNVLESIRYINLDYRSAIKKLSGISSFKNLEKISLKGLRQVQNLDELLKLENLKEIDLTDCNNINLDNILSKDWKQNIAIIYGDNNIRGYGITEIELPQYYYDIIKKSNINDVKTEILYDIKQEQGDLPNSGYLYYVEDTENKEATTFEIDDENKKVIVKLNNKITKEHTDTIRAMQLKICGGKYEKSMYTLFYQIQKVKMKEPPKKMQYLDGETFDATGLQLQILNEDGETYRDAKGYKAPKDKILKIEDGHIQTIEIEVEDEKGLIFELNDVRVWKKEWTKEIKIQDKNLFNALKDNESSDFLQALISYNDEEQILYFDEEAAQYITNLDLSNKNIKSIEGLSSLYCLEKLNLSNNKEITEIDELVNLQWLNTINIMDTGIDENNLEKVLELPNLQYLSYKTLNIKTENETKYLSYINGGNTYNEIFNNKLFKNKDFEIKIVNENKEEIDKNSIMKTGTKISLINKDNAEIEYEFDISIRGDIDCNGEVDLYDILNLIELVLDTDEDYIWNKNIMLAGKCVNDSDNDYPDLYDILALIEHVLDDKEW